MRDFKSYLLCALIAGGQNDGLPGIEQADFIVAADHGYDYAQKHGVIPDLIIGDFDSYRHPESIAADPELPEKCLQKAKRPAIIRLPREKDNSDTLAALKYCLELGYRKFRIYCALGGRMDHLTANLQACSFAAEQGAEIEIIGENEHIVFLHNTTGKFFRKTGFSLSVFSLSDTSWGVTIKGAKYQLKNAQLSRLFPIGLSNEWDHESVEISVTEGTLIVISSRL